MWTISRLCLLGSCAAFLALAGCSASESAEAARAKAAAEAAKAEVAQVKGELAQLKGEVAQVKGEVAQVRDELAKYRAAKEVGRGTGGRYQLILDPKGESVYLMDPETGELLRARLTSGTEEWFIAVRGRSK